MIRSPRSDRARITPVDALFVLVTLAFFAPLFQVFSSGFEANLSNIGTGPALILQLLAPMFVIVLLGVVYAKATQGV
jgi:hypothetical protein